MRLRELISLFAAICTVASLIYLILTPEFLPLAGAASQFPLSEREKWHPMINFTHNAFHMWRFDPLIVQALSEALDDAASTIWPVIVASMVIFSIGCSVLLYFILRSQRFLACLGIGPMISVVLMIIFGSDPVVLPALTWLPWLTLAVYTALKRDGFCVVHLLIALFFGYRTIVSANYLALPVIISALIASFLLVSRDSRKSHGAGLIMSILSIILASLAYFSSFSLPRPVIAEYPKDAHLVQDDGLPGNIVPLVGTAPRLMLIERDTLKSTYGTFCLALFALGICILAAARACGHQGSGLLISGAVTLTALVVLDTIPHEELSQIMPIASLTRIVPNLIYVPLTPIFTAFAVVYLLLGTFIDLESLFFALVCGLVICMLPTDFNIANYSFSPGRLLVKDGEAPYLSFLASANSAPSIDMKDIEGILISPSYFIIRKEKISLDSLRLTARPEHSQTMHISQLDAALSASHHNEPGMFALLQDHDPSTRWSAKRGLQLGDEWLLIRFNAPQSISGIVLHTGNFYTDFPRGLTIKSAASCNHDVASDHYQEIYRNENWQGRVHFSPKGFPFYGKQSDVSISFAVPVTTNCLLIEQTGKNKSFDWSVVELAFLPAQ